MSVFSHPKTQTQYTCASYLCVCLSERQWLCKVSTILTFVHVQPLCICCHFFLEGRERTSDVFIYYINSTSDVRLGVINVYLINNMGKLADVSVLLIRRIIFPSLD